MRYGQAEGAALIPAFAFHPGLSPMVFHQIFGNRQAYPAASGGPGAGRNHAVKPGESLGLVLKGNSDAIILHSNLDKLPSCFHPAAIN